MNYEIEAYVGELKDLRAHVNYSWTPIQCDHCGINCDLFMKGTKCLCRRCKQDHFSEEETKDNDNEET